MSDPFSRITFFAASCLLALAPSAASAEIPAPYGETTGTVWEAAFGVNGVTSDDYIDRVTTVDVDVGPIVGISLAGYYRPIDYLSLGLLAHYGFINAEFEDVDDDIGGFFGLLFEMRGHFPFSRFDPWVGFGFGYAMAFAAGKGDVSTGFGLGELDYDFKMVLHGVGLGVATGMNIFVTRHLALSPFFRMIFGIYPTGCYDFYFENLIDEEDCDDVDDVYDDLDDFPHLWIVGLGISYST